VLAFGTAAMSGRWAESVPIAALVVALVMAYGAVVTSLGLVLATWQPRLGRAVGLSVAAYLIAAVVYPTVTLMVLQPGPHDLSCLCLSPFFGLYVPLAWTTWGLGRGMVSGAMVVALPVWLAIISAVAYALWRVTLASFDRCSGRAPVQTRRCARPSPTHSCSAKPVRMAEMLD
jgi:hypothetical protein